MNHKQGQPNPQSTGIQVFTLRKQGNYKGKNYFDIEVSFFSNYCPFPSTASCPLFSQIQKQEENRSLGSQAKLDWTARKSHNISYHVFPQGTFSLNVLVTLL